MKQDWIETTLGDLCTFVRGPFGGSLKKSAFVDSGYAVYEQAHAINNQFSKIRYFIDDKKFNEMKRFELSSGDLIMSCSGTMGKIAIAPEQLEKGIINQALLKLTSNNKINNKFLKLWMESPNFQDSLNKYTKGAAIKNVVSVQILKAIKIRIPKATDKQKKIVEILDKAFEEIEQAKKNAQKNLQNAKDLFDSYVHSIYNSKNTGWKTTTLGAITEVHSGGTPSKPNKNYWNGDIPWYSSGELNNLYTKESKEFITEQGLKGSSAKLFPKGSLLIGMYDTAALKMSICHRDATFNQAIAGVKPNSNINLKFIKYSIENIKPEILSQRRGVRQKNLNLTKIKEIPIKLPTISEQNKIVEKLEILATEIQQLEQIYQQKIIALDELKQSILQKAFSGELLKEECLV